jgi:pyruvate/2-oxoglutarate dehydrogenase complex dihydrolipoamide acyltransferase (E2) component
MPRSSFELRLPELGLAEVPIRVCCWLVPEGRRVVEGDRLVEVWAGEVTVDLDAPATGTLIQRRVEEDEDVTVGQVLAVIRAEA